MLIKFIFLFFFLFIFFNHNTIEHIKFIVSKEDAIKHIETVMSIHDATNFYNMLFVNNNNLLVQLKNLNIPSECLPVISDILFDKGVYQHLPWKLSDKLTPFDLNVMTKQHLQYIYNINNYVEINWLDLTRIDKNNDFLYYDLMEIIKYNKYVSKQSVSCNMLIERHPVLNTYKNEIINLISNKYPSYNSNMLLKLSKKDFNNNVNISRQYILDNLTFKRYDNFIKNNIANSIYFILFTIYDDNTTLDNILNNPIFSVYKNNIINIVSNNLNKLRLFIQPNYNYEINAYLNNLLNSPIIYLNNLLEQIENIRDDIYLGQNLDNDIKIKFNNALNGTLNGTLNGSLKDFMGRDTNKILPFIRTNIMRRHSQIPYDLILKKITEDSLLVDINNALLFGLY